MKTMRDYLQILEANSRSAKFIPIRNDLITDLRSPDYEADQNDRTFIVLTKNGGAALFYYADGNKDSWRDVLAYVSINKDDAIQNDIHTICYLKGKLLISRSRETGNWAGDRNKYSSDMKIMLQALVDRGVCATSTSVIIGNWARREGEAAGTISSLISKEKPKQLTLFHGTSNVRLTKILQVGLQPLSLEQRVWNKGGINKERPAHRDHCVYLTASIDQAEYYARQSVKIDRKRLGPDAQYKARRDTYNAQQEIKRGQNYLNNLEDPDYIKRVQAQLDLDAKYNTHGWEKAEDQIAFTKSQYEKSMSDAEETIRKNDFTASIDHDGKIEPVILKVTLVKSDLSKLMADDDHLRLNPETSVDDWMTSLSQFSQVAYNGSISPSRLQVLKSK